jgi:hypothetical protein
MTIAVRDGGAAWSNGDCLRAFGLWLAHGLPAAWAVRRPVCRCFFLEASVCRKSEFVVLLVFEKVYIQDDRRA